jgi:ppGpp synthetase/RelA/SpoT-type nucleotidyltranferase
MARAKPMSVGQSPLPMSGRQIVKLGERLRDAGQPSSDDLRMLEEILLIYDRSLREVAEGLRSIGLEATTRLKTSGTIIEKVRREHLITLRSMRDLAGARVVQSMTLDEQDAVTGQVESLWPGARRVDRRATPSHGYRAVHVVVQVKGCPV